PAQVNLVALVHDRAQTTNIYDYIAGAGMIINALVDGGMSAELEVHIPNDKKSTAGYKISVLKVTEDVGEDGFVAEVQFTGID
ncbi:hypothetical protein ACI3PL_28245, partial [Lacticaseibacillus paracasei]